jgi:hypothetical protein
VINASLSSISSVIPGTVYNMHLLLEGNSYRDSLYTGIPAGYLKETFESGNLTQFPWITNGNEPWVITSDLPFEGNYCIRSGSIGNNQFSELNISINCIFGDSLTFMYKVSSEPVWDHLTLWVDSFPLKTWSGDIDWNYEGVFLAEGLHHLKFIYQKDLVQSLGQDAAWLDEIKFPPFSIVTSVTGIKNKVLIIYPNPANDHVYLNIPAENSLRIVLTDITGRSSAEIRIGQDGKLNLSDFVPGLYIIRISDGNTAFTSKLVIQRP